jgi:ubiquinone/menaquinone biosynthesis C-methylase UbiE
MTNSVADRSVPQAGQSWLEKHFEVNRTMYEAALRAVGIPKGARVLDAGCGPGSYLPWIAELVGPTGSITAMDVDADHVALVERMADKLPCKLSARVGSVVDLPFAAGEFDVVWLANTSVYFTDEEFMGVLAGLRRVVTPGGLVAVKDPDADLYRVRPLDPAIFAHYWETCARGGDKPFAKLVRGILRAGELRRFLEHAGLKDVRQQSFMQELWAPLRPVEHAWVMEFLTYYRDTAEEFGVPEADLAFWRTMTPAGYASSDHVINHPDFYYREGNTLAVGVVP